MDTHTNIICVLLLDSCCVRTPCGDMDTEKPVSVVRQTLLCDLNPYLCVCVCATPWLWCVAAANVSPQVQLQVHAWMPCDPCVFPSLTSAASIWGRGPIILRWTGPQSAKKEAIPEWVCVRLDVARQGVVALVPRRDVWLWLQPLRTSCFHFLQASPVSPSSC